MEADEAARRLQGLGLDLARSHFLHVGGNQWCKNRHGVVRLYADLAKHPGYGEHVLVMTGKPWTGKLRQLVDELGLGGGVVELVDVPNEDVRALYSRVEALLFPSLQEGFGWPIVEAQARGCPVAVTGRPPMTEVGGEAAMYIDPGDPVGAAARVVTGLRNRDRRQQQGLADSTRFTLNKMVNGYLRACGGVRAEQMKDRRRNPVHRVSTRHAMRVEADG